jgi:large subunit ribosomal protein L6
MSRIAKNPIVIPKNVDVLKNGTQLTIKGDKGTLIINLHPLVTIDIRDKILQVETNKTNKTINSLAGTTRAIINNMVIGVSSGYEKKLILIGVGYRAQGKGNILSLSLGYSHPIDFSVPDGITVDTPTQTEIIIKGCDKQIVGQVAADIRAFRPPEPYKGKGIRYSNEEIIKKEAKKK